MTCRSGSATTTSSWRTPSASGRRSLGGIEAARAAEDDPAAAFAEITAAVDEMGLFAITADGGSLLDLAVAVEACAAALVPGPLLGTAVASVVLGDAGRRRWRSRSTAPWSTTHRVRPTPWSWSDDEVRLVPARRRRPHARRQPRPDPSYLARRPDRRRGHRRTRPRRRAAARRSWSRSPPPRRPGSRGGAWTPRWSTPACASSSARRSAPSRRSSTCAREMLETSESVTAAAWDAARPSPTRRPSSEFAAPRRRRRSASTAPSRSPRTASRCSAGSASPSSTTPTSTCAGRSRCARWSAPRARTPPGWPTSPPTDVRRHVHIDLDEAEDDAACRGPCRGRADRRPARRTSAAPRWPRRAS